VEAGEEEHPGAFPPARDGAVDPGPGAGAALAPAAGPATAVPGPAPTPGPSPAAPRGRRQSPPPVPDPGPSPAPGGAAPLRPTEGPAPGPRASPSPLQITEEGKARRCHATDEDSTERHGEVQRLPTEKPCPCNDFLVSKVTIVYLLLEALCLFSFA